MDENRRYAIPQRLHTNNRQIKAIADSGYGFYRREFAIMAFLLQHQDEDWYAVTNVTDGLA